MGIQRLQLEERLQQGAMVELDRARSHYLLHVLRLKAGRNVLLFNAQDGEWLSSVRDVGRHSVRLEVQEQTRAPADEPGPCLVMPPIRQSRFEWVVEKAVELGVAAIQPVLTQHTAARLEKTDRLLAIATEAAEQCGRITVPRILDPLPFDTWLEARDIGSQLWFADERRQGKSIVDLLGQGDGLPPDVLIGPEGGFSEAERLAAIAARNVVPIDLGPRILRAETAAVAVLAALGVAGSREKKPGAV